MAIRISQEAFEGIEACRKSGDLNMLDYHGVMKWCYDREYFKSVAWLHDNKKAYGNAIFHGFDVRD